MTKINPPKKISIVGNSGAGKSFLAKKLAAKLKFPLFVVDKTYWLPGWVLRDEPSFNAIHDAWLEKEAWIIDGVGYWAALQKRLQQADLILFLDYPIETCLQQAEERIEKEKRMPNADITAGCRYAEVRDLQVHTIREFHSKYRPMLMDLINFFEPQKVLRISNQNQLDAASKAMMGEK